MDGLRGVAILAVVAYHADLVVDGPDAVAALNRLLEPVRMPLLMCLSGMLLHRSLAKGAAAHLRGKVEALLWPYVVWAGLDTLHVLVDTAVAGEPVPWEWVPMLAYAPQSYLWFLLALFWFHVVSTPLPPSARTLAGPVLLLVGTSVDGGPARLVALLGWFLLGDTLAREVGARVPAGVAAPAARARWGVLARVGRSSVVFYAVHLLVMVYVGRLLAVVPLGEWGRFACAMAVPLAVGALLVHGRRHGAVDLLFRLPPLGSTVGSASAARVAVR